MGNNSTATLAVRLTMQGASQLVAGMHSVVSAGGKIKDTLGGMNQQAFYFIANARSLSAELGKMGNALIQPNVSFEQFEEQMSYLPGMAGQAKDELQKLYKAANQEGMPFDDMAKMALVMRRVGDESIAGSNDLGVWIRAAKLTGQTGETLGREVAELYNTLERGDDVTRSLKGMSKAGLISADADKQIKELIAGQASAGDVFAAITAAVAESTRNVGQFGTTWGDVMNRGGNMAAEFKRQLGEGLFKAVKGDVDELTQEVNVLFESGRITKWAEEAGAKIKSVYEGITNLSLNGVKLPDLMAAGEQGKLGELLGAMFQTAAGNFWQEMVYGAAKYGPDIQRALIPTRLHGVLGLDQESERARMETRDRTARVFSGNGSAGDISAEYLKWANPYTAVGAGVSALWHSGDREGKPLLPPQLKSMENTQLLSDIRDPWMSNMIAGWEHADAGQAGVGYRMRDSMTGDVGPLMTKAEMEETLRKQGAAADQAMKAADKLEQAAIHLAYAAESGARF